MQSLFRDVAASHKVYSPQALLLVADANSCLQRHRLVKGCENKTDGGNADESQDRNGGPSSATAGSEQAPRPAM